MSRLTFEAQNSGVTWSANNQSVTFVSSRIRGPSLWTKRADGTDTAELVANREAAIREGIHSSDGTWLVFREGIGGPADIYAIRPGADTVAVAMEVTEFSERGVSLSRNDRWLAYVSNRTGRNEVYVRPFPDAGSGLVQVSADGGSGPVWAHNGRELFYWNGANELVVVQFTEDPTFATVREDVLFPMNDYLTRRTSHPLYDVSPDDQRFVMLRILAGAEDDTELILLENFFEELKERVPNE